MFGNFYEGNTISITVIPKTGYSFSGWGGYSEDLFNMQLFENTELTAIFTEVIVTSDPEITATCITNFDKSIIVPVIILIGMKTSMIHLPFVMSQLPL